MKKTIFPLVICLTLGIIAFTIVPSRVHAVPFNYGDVFAAVNNGNVYHYDNAGNYIETLNTGTGGYTTGMAFDATGNLYVTCLSASAVVRFDNVGTNLGSIGSGYSGPESIVFDSAGNFYVGNTGNGIHKYDASGTFLGTVINVRVDWFDLTADESTLYYGQEGTVVKTISNAIPGVPGPDFATGLNQAFAMRILSDGGLLVADRLDIKRFDSSGSLVATYDVAGQDNWFALNLDPDGSSFWSGDYYNDRFFRFDIATGTVLAMVDTGLGDHHLYGLTVYGERTAPGSIAGMKFNDLDGDGIRDVGEPGLAGWTIELTDASGIPVATTTTDANGKYLFTLLPDGTYTVSEVLQAGWTQTVPTSGTYTITIEQGADITDVDFGNTEREVNPIPLFSDVLLLLSLGLLAGAMVIQRRRKMKNKN
jgi:hypothetical protein